MKTSRSQKSEVRSQIFLFSVFCFLFSVLCGCNNQRLYKETRVMMGTFVEVTSPDRNAPQIAFAEIKRIEDLLSKYKEDSEISKLNKLGKLKVTPETFYVIKKSRDFWRLSGGAFDITVGPLLDLWGFTDKKFSVPKKNRIKNILRLIGSDKIILHSSDSVVEFKISGMRIDLGAIAKGYALDCAANKLKQAGIKSCLINAGGQVYALGEKFGKPWEIAIRNPRSHGIEEVLELKDMSVATSGDYEQYFIRNNKRYAHILDPKTGFPADSSIAAVTVVAPSGLTADALATAIFVLGKEKGKALAKRFPDTQVKIIEDEAILK